MEHPTAVPWPAKPSSANQPLDFPRGLGSQDFSGGGNGRRFLGRLCHLGSKSWILGKRHIISASASQPIIEMKGSK
jgi:hypothetical protein